MEKAPPSQNEKSDTDFEKIVQKRYQHVLEIFKRYDFDITMAESSLLRETTRKTLGEVAQLEKNNKNPNFYIDQEIICRFFWYYYGINFNEYLKLTKLEYQEKAVKDFFQHVKEKLRKDTELI